MNLIVNGQSKDVAMGREGANIAGLVSQCCKNKRHIMAELNGHIVMSADWEKAALKDGDHIELVAFVGGG